MTEKSVVHVAVSLDVEEEGLFTGQYARRAYTVANTACLKRLDPLCEQGVRPTLFCAYSVFRDAAARRELARLRDTFGAEIGAHLHHWNTPPLTLDNRDDSLPDTARNVSSGDVPLPLMAAKLKSLFDAGRDFQSVLTEIVRIKEPQAPEVPLPEKGSWPYADLLLGDGWSLAYRVLDAQGWGVPQRRRRIYLVADLGGACAGQILFDAESVLWHLAPRFASWQGTAGELAPRLGAAGERLSAGFSTEHSAKSYSIGYAEEKSPTLRAGRVPAALFESHGADARYEGPLEICPTVVRHYGTGGNNQPLVMKDVQAYGISSFQSNAMKSDNPHSGIYETETARTVDKNGGNPSCCQGGVAVVSIQGSMIGRQEKNGPQGSGIAENVSFTLNTADRHAVYAMTTGCHSHFAKEKCPTLMARDFKDPMVVNQPVYAVRRLTPTECGRLQGFPDGWCENLETDEPTEEEMAFWRDVFETYRKAMGTAKKPKTDNQIRKWLKNPHSDAAEYKMWGNGVALPCVFYVLSGIAHFAAQEA